ncbi:MAG: hypothetical protein O9275_20455, partial [Microcystis sp. LE19-196.1B]|nr:hypothetical protein [Microcystis sp. LE19-196.1B]
NKLRLTIDRNQLAFYSSKDEFKKVNTSFDLQSVLILDGSRNYSFINGKTFINFEEKQDFFYFSNASCYLEFILFLKSLISSDEKEFHFIDSYNFDFRRITMINFSEKGRLNISYSAEIPDFDTSIDYSKGFRLFKDCFQPENKSLPKFLKSEIIKLGQSFDENKRLKNIFESLEKITEKAYINFDVYLNEISVEKLKKDYDDLKTKYFKELSETLGKITQKLIGLPIGVSTSLIAIDRLSGSPQFLFLLLSVIVSTSIVLSALINANLKDLNDLKEIFLIDYKVLSENKFFSKYPKELDLFSRIKESFVGKTSFYFNLSHIIYFAMNIANTFLILFIFKALKTDDSAIILLVIICFGV